MSKERHVLRLFGKVFYDNGWGKTRWADETEVDKASQERSDWFDQHETQLRERYQQLGGKGRLVRYGSFADGASTNESDLDIATEITDFDAQARESAILKQLQQDFDSGQLEISAPFRVNFALPLVDPPAEKPRQRRR